MKIISTDFKFCTKEEIKEFLTNKPNTNDENQETIKQTVLEYCNQEQQSLPTYYILERLIEKGLTQFEAYQLVDIQPKTLLCLQLIIEEMEERYSEVQLQEILSLFN
ncbi:hypothetical protein COBT_002219 [Conglomerata obtusa]